MGSEAIRLENIWFAYRDTPVIKNLSLNIEEGEILALLGPNGAGKTTVLKLMTGIITPTRGRVLVAGLDTKRTPVSALARHIGYVPQSPWVMFSRETVYDEITFTARNIGLPREFYEKNALHIASWLGIEELLDESPFSLSEGEARRVALAAALVHNPKILLLDEPTSALDLRGKKSLAQLLRLLHSKGGYSMVMATHDIDFLTELGNPRVVILNAGEKRFDSNLRIALQSPRVLEENMLEAPSWAAIATMLSSLIGNKFEEPESIDDLVELVMLSKSVLWETLCRS